MHVVLFTSHFPPDIRSASLLMADLADSLASRNHLVSVITSWSEGRGNGASSDARVRVFRLPVGLDVRKARVRRGVEQAQFAALGALRALRLPRPDVVFAYSPPLPLGLTCAVLKALRHSPYVFNAQDLYPQTAVDLGLLRNSFLVWLLRWIERVAYRHAQLIVVHSPGNATYVRSLGFKHVEVVPNWVDTEAIRPGLDGGDFVRKWGLSGKFVVTFAGVVGYAQGLGVVLRAAKRLESLANITFLIVGEGSQADNIRSLARSLGLTNVVFKPFVSPSDFPRLLAISDIGLVTLSPDIKTPVVPSKLGSIMAAGKPVIAAVPRRNDTRSMVEEARCGVVVDADDDENLARAILQIYSNPELALSMGVAGRNFSERNLSRESVLRRLVSLIEEVAGFNATVRDKDRVTVGDSL